MSASAIRMGRAYVEIGADSRKFFGQLSKVNGAIKNMGASIASAGAKLTAAGLSASAPFAASIRSGAAYQDQLLGIKASTGATADQIKTVDEAAMQMSRDMGLGPKAIAESFLALLKAGMPLEKVLGGAGEAALHFAKVGSLEFTQAAEVMSDAMNAFKVDSKTATNVISSAADSSSTSIEQMAWSFSMASAAAGLANQNIQDTAAALAIMANNGVKGSDAGTSLKTMFLRLMAPVDETIGAMQEVGLTVDSFRDSFGKMLPLVQIIDRLNGAMSNLDQKAKDDIMRRIFGADALRSAAILGTAGREGFQAMANSMEGAMPIGEKFNVLMSGLSGGGTKLFASLERLAIAVSTALAPSLTAAAASIGDVIDRVAAWVTENQAAVLMAAKVVAGVMAIGAALTVVGVTMAGIGAAAGVVISAVAGLGSLLTATGFAGQAALALIAGGAARVFSDWLMGQKAVADAVEPWLALIQNSFFGMLSGLEIGFVRTMDAIHRTVLTVGAVIAGAFDNLLNPFFETLDQLRIELATLRIGFGGTTEETRKRAAELNQTKADVAAARKDRAENTGIANRIAAIGPSKISGEVAQIHANRIAARQSVLNGVEERRKERELAAAAAAKPAEMVAEAIPRALEAKLPPMLQHEMAPDTGGIAAAAEMQNQSVGSFSALNAGGMGFGSSITILKDQLEVQKKMVVALESMGPYVA